MEARLFLALQCVQCATMQVKQQKKSSNKWVCAVCNKRQSVLRVHARGNRAADVRRFVQDANLARGRREFAPLAEPDEVWDPAAVGEQADVLPVEKRQTEWSEYLDDLGEPGNGLGADTSVGDEGIEVITELPQKRPKVRPLKAQPDVVGKRAKLSSACCATTTAEGDMQTLMTYHQTLVQRSKSSLFGERKGSHTSGLHWTEHGESASTVVTTDEVVEDEVHPDFI